MIHVPTGQILAMVSEPGYDLNRYYDDYRLLTAEPTNLVYLPLLHRAVALRHPPGSTVKPITALAGLATGTITPDTVLPCAPGYMGKSPTNFRCWIYKRYHRPHDDLDLVEAIMRSCNVYFFRVGDQVGHDALCQWFSLLGYDRPCGTGLPEEKSGRVPDSRWYRRVADRGVYPSDTWNMSIGQGEIGPTPLHVANAMATIARDGVLLSPRISLNAGPEQVRQTLPIPGEYIAAVREGMKRVVNQRDGGTAYRHFHGAGVGLDVTLCGKTGTAETAPQRVDSNENGRIDGQDMIVRQGDTAWFAGFAPHENPQVAFAVVVEYCQGGGGTNAGPIAREMVRLADELHYLQPAPE
jgi:penicillin-binding protein 2